MEAIVSNFSHSSMIIPRPLFRVRISVLVLSNEKRICIRSFTGRWKSMPYHFDVDALSNGRFNRFNGIPFHHQSNRSTLLEVFTFVRNSTIPTKYGTVNEVELCLKILSTKLSLFPIVIFNFFYILNARQEEHSI